MEQNNSLPRTAPFGDAYLRDLPLADRAPLPRMEVVPDDDGINGGCGCDGDRDRGRDRNEDRGRDCGRDCSRDCGRDRGGVEGGVCVGYEGCGEDSWGLTEHPLAMVYAPCQSFRALYDPATALSRGTMFTELDLPLGGTEGAFTTVGCACRAERRRV